MNKTNNKYCYWLNIWLNSKKLSVKESTYIRYRNIINNHILPEIGNYPIDKINTSIMESFVTKKLKSGRLDGKGGLSTKSIADIMIVIKESFRYSSDCGANIVCEFKRLSIRKKNSKIRVLSVSDEKKLVMVLFNNIDRYKLGVFICLYTGIRIGELCALRWKDIYFDESIMKIKHTTQRIQKVEDNSCIKTHLVITEPKSDSSSRDIPLPRFVIDIIKDFEYIPEAYVITGKSNVIPEPRTMQYKFKTYLKEGNIEYVNFHALRHTFATRCVEAGFDIKTLSEILGHSNVKITLEKYVHSSMQLKRNNMDKLQPAMDFFRQ